MLQLVLVLTVVSVVVCQLLWQSWCSLENIQEQEETITHRKEAKYVAKTHSL